MTTISEFIVRKDKLSEGRVETREAPALKDGEVLAKIDRFALTANNVTYGVVGERIGYWKFFPVAKEGDGIIPVWGFADVVESNNPEVPVGERLYGYFPMASHLVMKPEKASETRLFDGAAHRAGLPPVYNSYARVKAEPGYNREMDDDRMVLFPLYATSFCLYDFMKDKGWFGAEQAIIASASSKTAIGTAYAIAGDKSAPRLVGLTSARNKPAVEKLKLYADVFTYDEIEKIDASRPALIIDMSGNGEVLGRLHKHLGDNMKFTSNVGVTHYEQNAMGPDFIAERSEMFFAPGHIQKRAEEWGPGGFEKQAFAFWKEAAIKSHDWLIIRRENGSEAVARAWKQLCAGETPADAAWVVGF
ncbi:DUF2855 family protein [Hyphococcus luteus]|uniref:DUF2855 domain-containing protein n=1 Tax=Hyphococcus luteus TaxID=2058213 RepID=A0A2S7K8B2_9PROT|nr:DUF2855 family protein [Marinicaulis flavus]PQA88736.1 DUF2855 domain-containing protein [Marinicaulis flavus]